MHCSYSSLALSHRFTTLNNHHCTCRCTAGQLIHSSLNKTSHVYSLGIGDFQSLCWSGWHCSKWLMINYEVILKACHESSHNVFKLFLLWAGEWVVRQMEGTWTTYRYDTWAKPIACYPMLAISPKAVWYLLLIFLLQNRLLGPFPIWWICGVCFLQSLYGCQMEFYVS